jgi:hypothetical protein
VIISKHFSCALIFVAFSLILLSFLSSVQAQAPKGDVYLGYSRTGTDTFYPKVGGLNGWEGALHIKLHKPFIGIEGNVSHYGLGADSTVPRTTTGLFGPRFTLGVLGPKVFAHALLGGEHSAVAPWPTHWVEAWIFPSHPFLPGVSQAITFTPSEVRRQAAHQRASVRGWSSGSRWRFSAPSVPRIPKRSASLRLISRDLAMQLQPNGISELKAGN